MAPHNQPPFACADGAGRPASPMGIPSPSHFAPPAFDTSVEHPTIHPSIPVSTRRSLPRLLRPTPHDQIGMARRPTRPQPRRWLFCAVPLLPEVAHYPLPTLRHRFAPPRTPGPRNSPRHAAVRAEPGSRPATFGTAPDNPSMQQPPCDGFRRRDTSPYDSPSEEKYVLASKRPQCPPCAPARSSRVPPPPTPKQRLRATSTATSAPFPGPTHAGVSSSTVPRPSPRLATHSTPRACFCTCRHPASRPWSPQSAGWAEPPRRASTTSTRARGNGHIRCQTRERRVGGRRDDLLRTSRKCIKGRSATAVSTANARYLDPRHGPSLQTRSDLPNIWYVGWCVVVARPGTQRGRAPRGGALGRFWRAERSQPKLGFGHRLLLPFALATD